MYDYIKDKRMKKYYLLLTSLSILGLSGCTSPTAINAPSSSYKPTTTYHKPIQSYQKPTPNKLALYQQTMRTIASGITQDPNYRRIALDTAEKKEWFRDLTYRLWDRQITRSQFITEGLSRFPTHRYEFEFIVNGFENICTKNQ